MRLQFFNSAVIANSKMDYSNTEPTHMMTNRAQSNLSFSAVGKTQGSSRMDGRCRTNLLLSRGGVWNFNSLLHWPQAQQQLLHGRSHERPGELWDIAMGEHHHVLFIWV